MINNINKNISVWRGEQTPPTEYHVWIKSNGSVLINKDGTWFTQISESTNDSVNVCNLCNDGYQPTLATAIQTVSTYLGTEVFHVGYKLRYNEAPVGYDPVWKEYILTGSRWYWSDNWKLVFTTDLMNNEEIIKSGHLPSYVDDVLEYSSVTKFPIYGESGKIYVDTSANKSYRWSGTQYILIALTDIVTADTMGLMSPEMYNKLEKTASDLDIHDRQNQAAFAEISTILDKKVGKIVDAKGNIISEGTSVATIPDGTDQQRGLLTPDVYNLVNYLDNSKVDEIKDFQGNVLPKVGTIVTIPNATTQTAGLMTPDDKEILNKIQPEFVKDLGLVASTDEGDQMAAKSEIAGNINISFIRYRTAGVHAEKVTTIFQWRNGINETAQIKFVDKAQWRRNVTGATGVVGAPTNAFKWERTGAHYLGYDAASRTLQLQDYNQSVIKTVQLPLAQNGADNVVDGLISSEDIASIITKADFNRQTGEIYLNNKANNRVTSLVIPIAASDGMGLMSQYDVMEMGTLTNHRNDRNNPHQVTKAQVGLSKVTNDAQVKRSEMGVANGVALLDSEGKISSSYLPSYVSDIITVNSYPDLPTTGEEDKIYVTKDTNLTYRWSGTAYVEISPSIALGETSTTAYAGDKGKNLSNSVYDLKIRVGYGYLDTETLGYAKIGTGDTRVKIVPGADILASVVGQGSSFTISSNTDTASIGYGASIGQNSILGAGLSASINNVTGPNGSTRQGIILKDINDDNGIKILCRNNGEFLVSTSVYNNDWIDLARLGKISTMINVSGPSGLSIDPSILTENSNDSEISIGTNTTIGSNVIIGSYVKVSTSIEDDGTGYILLGDKTTKIKKGVTIDRNSGSSEQLVHYYTKNDLNSWMIGLNPTPNTTGVQLGEGIIILGTSQLNQPILIKAQNRNNATALIGANFNAYSGVTLGSYSSLGNQAKLGDNVEIIQGASGLTIVSNDYGMTVGTKVSIGNNVSLGNNSWLGQDSYLASGSHMGKNSAVRGNVYISTGVQLGEGIIILGTNQLNQPILIKAQNRNNATALIGANFNAYSGVTLGTNATFGDRVNLETDVVIKAHTHIGGEVSIGNNVSIPNNFNVADNVLSLGTNVSVSDTGNEVSVGDVTISTGIRITKNASATTIQNGNGSDTAGGKLQFGTGNIIWSGVEIGTGVHITEDLTSDSTSYKLGETNQTTIRKNLNISGNVDQVDVLLKPSEGEAGKIKIQDTIGNANWLTLENKNNILAGDFYGGSMSTIWSGAEIGTGVKITEDLTADNTSYKLGETNQVTIGKNVKLGASLGIAANSYTLDDPDINIRISTIGQATVIYSEVTIGTGIQIQDSPAGGLQIYSPSQGKWITISG